MKRKASRQITRLLRLIEEKQEQIIKCEERMEDARRRLENRERGWSKARYAKVKMKLSEQVRGLRGAINRLEKQRLNVERREREQEEEEIEELERSIAIEAEEEKLLMKEKKAKTRKKMKKKKKKKVKKRSDKEEKVKRELSEAEKRMETFAMTFVKAYRSGVKGRFEDKKKRSRIELYGKYPYHVTVVFKVPEIEEVELGEGEEKKVVKKKKVGPLDVMLVFSSPRTEELEVDMVEEKGFDLGNYKEIFRTVLVPVSKWSEAEAKSLAEEYVVRDTE